MMTRGRVEPNRLSSDVAVYDELDERIIKLAGRKLKGSLKTTFFFAYACKEWEEIQLLFLEKYKRELDLATVKRYGDRAAAAIETAARNAAEFN